MDRRITLISHSLFLIGFLALEPFITNHQVTYCPTYWRMVGTCVLMVSYPGNKGSYNVAGKSFLYLVIILVHGFMKSVTVALQRLALHDPNHLVIKILLFIKSYHSSRRMINHK